MKFAGELEKATKTHLARACNQHVQLGMGPLSIEAPKKGGRDGRKKAQAA